MRPVSDGFADAVRASSQERVSRVSLLDADLGVSSVITGAAGIVIDGSVSTSSDRRRSCDLSLVDPDGTWAPVDASDALFPNRLVRLERGLVVDGEQEYVSLGVFLIDRPTVTVDAAGSLIRVTGQDRLKLALRSRFTQPTLYPAGMRVELVVQAIAQDAGMGDTLYRLDDAGKSLMVERTFDTGTDRIAALDDLCAAYALRYHVDADGVFVLEPSLAAMSVDDPAWIFTRGTDAIMLGITKDLSDDRWYNHVLVSGEASDLVPVAAEARDLNPDSPGYNPEDGSGPIGDRLYTYTSAMIRSEEQAQSVADALLFDVALIEEAVSIPAIVHPALEVGDLIGIVEPLSRTNDWYYIDTLSIPLGAGAMTLTTRRVRSLIPSEVTDETGISFVTYAQPGLSPAPAGTVFGSASLTATATFSATLSLDTEGGFEDAAFEPTAFDAA